MAAEDSEEELERKTVKRDGYDHEVCRPLIVTICIAEDGNENDSKAKTIDYKNILSTMNQDLKLDCAFLVDKKDNDENKDDLPAADSLVHVGKERGGLLSDENMEQYKFKTVWTKEEITSFLKQCVPIINERWRKGEFHRLDGLFVVITAHASKEDKDPKDPKGAQKDSENDKPLDYFQQVKDSFGNLLDLKEIFQIFDAKNFDWDMKHFPKMFMFDRYFEVETREEAFKYNVNGYKMDLIDLSGEQCFQFYTHVRSLATSKASEKGGTMSRAMREVFKIPPAEPSCGIYVNKVHQYLDFMVEYIRKNFEEGMEVTVDYPNQKPCVEFEMMFLIDRWGW